jgi:hypothetical protein
VPSNIAKITAAIIHRRVVSRGNRMFGASVTGSGKGG